MNQGKTWWYDLVAGLVNRILPNEKQHPSQFLISSNYNLYPESIILKEPQTDNPYPGTAFSVALKQTVLLQGLHSAYVASHSWRNMEFI